MTLDRYDAAILDALQKESRSGFPIRRAPAA
jgi:hypothetical protein